VPCAIRHYLRRVAHLWSRLLPLVAVLYLGYENLEQLRTGLPITGLPPMTDDPLWPMLMIAVTSLVAATVAALADWCRCVLYRRLGMPARLRIGRSADRLSAHVIDWPLGVGAVGLASAGRSPPSWSVDRP